MAKGSPLEGKKVLVVDDSEDSGELTARRLAKAGLDAHFHKGPFGTVVAVREGGYDVVLMDVKMPALSGTQVMEIMDNRDAPAPPVILYSSVDESDLRELAHRSGAAGFVSKSASKDRLLEVIASVLG